MSRQHIDLPDDLYSVVHPHRLLTTGYLVWASEGPQRLCREEIRRIGRNRTLETAADPNAFPLDPSGSWVVAMPVADGGEAATGVEWARGLDRIDRARLAFFTLPGVDASAIVDLCDDVLGVDTYVVPIESTFSSFHRVFGRFLNLWTYQDVKAGRI